ncbi:hypothetical protein LOTGIDRAFT_200574 [Lottia gigantea]|uniref:AB hydrolase-1 domain-containing protein n=1 Tax=Lottia gigantea TaxID=225164 RepID=V4AA94_LOTGI|nr:hypothetical protein LOTGIDRAFT_200574 [Lottia gigantea]ESP00874.1 hypothetical protein LOTGIDRAFT_200574 [Lottia gigantea]
MKLVQCAKSLRLFQSSKGLTNYKIWENVGKSLSMSNQCWKKDEKTEKGKSEYYLPQLETPCYKEFTQTENGGTQSNFKGLETDFPCLTRNKTTGPEPDYQNVTEGFKVFTSTEPFHMRYNNGILPELKIAYETWGTLNETKSNAVLVMAGLSASSHAKSHKDNPLPGWWEKFVGPGCAIDTNEFFVICTNNLGGCYGSSGPSTINPLTNKRYATTFPIVSIVDMAKAQFLLLDFLGIERLHASVGSSLGGMLSLMSAALYPERMGRFVSISSCASSHPSSIAIRYLQRKCIMSDPNWNKGYYYDKPGGYPKVGMKLARELATMTYRSGPEWDLRFGRGFIEENENVSLCPTFTIESYIEYQGETFSTKFDPNSLLYISKAMDLFNIGEEYKNTEEAFKRIQCPAMILGVQSDILFPIWQQRELYQLLQKSGNPAVTFYELNSIYGHDTFLLDLNGVGAAVKGFLETNLKQYGWNTKHQL